MSAVTRRLEKLGISPERFRVEWISAAEGGKYSRVITDMDQTLKEIGPVRIQEENEKSLPGLEKRLAHVPDLIFSKQGN